MQGFIGSLHCERQVQLCGFEKVTGWECLYIHKKEGLILSIYVDDFKMGGRKEAIPKMWKLLKNKGQLELDPPVPSETNTYLGMVQSPCRIPDELINEKRKFWYNLMDMEDPFAAANGEDKSLSGLDTALIAKPPKTVNNEDIKGYQNSLIGNAIDCVQFYCDLAGIKVEDLKKVPTPCLDDSQLPPSDFETKGELASVSSRVVLKALWFARLTRPDLYWTINHLARQVTKWNVACDKRLKRLNAYIHHTENRVQYNYAGDHPRDCKLVMFADASFAGDIKDSKSTTGGILYLMGPNTCVHLNHIVKKQGAVSHSSTEVEVIALDTCLRTEALPALMLWEKILEMFIGLDDTRMAQAASKDSVNKMPLLDIKDAGRQCVRGFEKMLDYVPCNIPVSSGLGQLFMLEDNEPVIKISIKRRWPQLKHVPRTHRIDLDWIFDRINEDPGVNIRHVGTKNQLADMLTKGMFTEQQFNSLVSGCLLGPKLPELVTKTTSTARDESSAVNPSTSSTLSNLQESNTNNVPTTTCKRRRKRFYNSLQVYKPVVACCVATHSTTSCDDQVNSLHSCSKEFYIQQSSPALHRRHYCHKSSFGYLCMSDNRWNREPSSHSHGRYSRDDDDDLLWKEGDPNPWEGLDEEIASRTNAANVSSFADREASASGVNVNSFTDSSMNTTTAADVNSSADRRAAISQSISQFAQNGWNAKECEWPSKDDSFLIEHPLDWSHLLYDVRRNPDAKRRFPADPAGVMFQWKQEILQLTKNIAFLSGDTTTSLMTQDIGNMNIYALMSNARNAVLQATKQNSITRLEPLLTPLDLLCQTGTVLEWDAWYPLGKAQAHPLYTHSPVVLEKVQIADSTLQLDNKWANNSWINLHHVYCGDHFQRIRTCVNGGMRVHRSDPTIPEMTNDPPTQEEGI